MERERGGRVKVINYLQVATAKNLQNININKKKKKQTMQDMLQLLLRATPAAKIFKPGLSLTVRIVYKVHVAIFTLIP